MADRESTCFPAATECVSHTLPPITQSLPICERAANDYRLLTRSDAVGWWDAGWQELEKRRVEDFFLSPFGNLLAFGKGADILNTLRKEEARL